MDRDIQWMAKPSMRRAYFYGLIYAGFVGFGRLQLPEYDQLWYGLFGVLVVLLLVTRLRSICTKYMVTTDEVHAYTGILARDVAIVPISKITNVGIEQAVLERLLGIATVKIDTAGGTAAPEILFQRIVKQSADACLKKLKSLQASPEAPRAAAAGSAAA